MFLFVFFFCFFFFFSEKMGQNCLLKNRIAKKGFSMQILPAKTKINPCNHTWTAPSEKVSEHAQNAQIKIHHGHAQSHPDICSSLIYSIVSNDSVRGQGRL